MGAVFMMVGDVLGKKPLQGPLVASSPMVEQLAAAAPHPTLGDHHSARSVTAVS
jgi:hypothetical protein